VCQNGQCITTDSGNGNGNGDEALLSEGEQWLAALALLGLILVASRSKSGGSS